MNDFYIYRHIRPDTGAVFYIGKGRGYRFSQKTSRNKHWKNIVNLSKTFESEIMISGLSEQESFHKEIEFIKIYRDAGYKLANKTNGGDGTSGVIRSDEWKRKQSIARKGQVSNRKGCKLSPQTKEKLRFANLGKKLSESTRNKMRSPIRPHNCKKVKDLTTGVIWENAKMAAKAYGINYPVFIYKLHHNSNFKYVGDK